MGNTVRFSSIAQAGKEKRFADLQSGTITIPDYLNELNAARSVQSFWSGTEYVIDFGRGIADPNISPDLDPRGQPANYDLTLPEIEQIIRALMPSPLESAGKTIRLRGPMPGFAAALICRECYAATVIVESLDRAQGGQVIGMPIEKLGRDLVRLVQPDTSEIVKRNNNGVLLIETSQISYRRSQKQPPFGYYDILNLAFIETNARDRRGNLVPPKAQVQDQQGIYAWVYDLADLEDA